MADNNKTVDELRSTINSDMDNIGMTTPHGRPINRIKNPLVSAWSDYLGWIEESDYTKTGLTAQALKQCIDDIKSLLNIIMDYIDAKSVNVFSGRMVHEQPVYEDIEEYTGNPVVVNNSININTLTKPGVFRVGKSEEIQFDSNNRPPIMNDDSTGYLTVFNIDKDSTEIGIRIRQIYYPDNSSEGSPMTRVCYNEEWSVWEGMGGGLRRIFIDDSVVEDTITRIVRPQYNCMYESYTDGDHLILPDPANVPIGVKIGVTKHSGDGLVSCVTSSNETFEQRITPAVDNPIASIEYLFECCIAEDGTTREWVMDYEHNEAATLAELTAVTSDLNKRATRSLKHITLPIYENDTKYCSIICQETTSDGTIDYSDNNLDKFDILADININNSDYNAIVLVLPNIANVRYAGAFVEACFINGTGHRIKCLVAVDNSSMTESITVLPGSCVYRFTVIQKSDSTVTWAMDYYG